MTGSNWENLNLLQSVWKHINVPLCPLNYGHTTISGQEGKGSTEWAAHSHTPTDLQVWDEFDDLVNAEGRKPRNERCVEVDLIAELNGVRLPRVTQVEHVTDSLVRLLEVFSDDQWDLSGGFHFPKKNLQIIAFPDLIAEKKDPEVVCGDFSEYVSPPKRHDGVRGICS
jgi:hypothetical protein